MRVCLRYVNNDVTLPYLSLSFDKGHTNTSNSSLLRLLLETLLVEIHLVHCATSNNLLILFITLSQIINDGLESRDWACLLVGLA